MEDRLLSGNVGGRAQSVQMQRAVFVKRDVSGSRVWRRLLPPAARPVFNKSFLRLCFVLRDDKKLLKPEISYFPMSYLMKHFDVFQGERDKATFGPKQMTGEVKL